MAIQYIGNTISGVSGDTKPTLSANEKGVIFIETDTNKIYQWDTDSWNEIVLSDASTSAKGIASFSSDNFAASSGAITIKDGGVILGTETTGNYVATVAGTSNEVNVSGSTGAVTIGLPDDVTIAQDLVVTRNLTVSGTTVTANVDNLTIEDPLLYLANGQSSSPAFDSGFVVERGNTTNVAFIWDESADEFVAANVPANEVGTTAGNVTIDSYADLKVGKFTVDDVVIDGKVVTMTGSSSDTAVFTVGTNGTLSIVTTDDNAAAGNIQITADGTVDIDSAGVLTLDSGAAINIEPAAGSAILLDGTLSVDAGVVTGATSITSTAFVGDLTGDVTGNTSGTAATVTTAAQSSITSLGTLTTLTVDSIIINGTNIGHTSDSDAIAISSGGVVTMNQIPVFSAGINVSGGTIAGTLSTAAQANITSLGTLTALTGGTGNFTWDTNTFFVKSSNNRVGIGTADPSNMLHMQSASSFEAHLEVTGNDFPLLLLDSDRSGASASLGDIVFQWNGTYVSQIRGLSGADTTNKDDGQLTFHTRPSGGSMTERLRIGIAGEIGIGGANYGTDGQVLTSTGGSTAPAWEDAGGGGDTGIVAKAARADQTVADTTLVDHDDFSFSVEANKNYSIFGVIHFTSAMGTDGKFHWTGPTGGWMSSGQIRLFATNSHGLTTWTYPEYDVQVDDLYGDQTFFFWAHYDGGANAGTLQFQFAQWSSNATVLTVKEGSFIQMVGPVVQ